MEAMSVQPLHQWPLSTAKVLWRPGHTLALRGPNHPQIPSDQTKFHHQVKRATVIIIQTPITKTTWNLIQACEMGSLVDLKETNIVQDLLMRTSWMRPWKRMRLMRLKILLPKVFLHLIQHPLPPRCQAPVQQKNYSLEYPNPAPWWVALWLGTSWASLDSATFRSIKRHTKRPWRNPELPGQPITTTTYWNVPKHLKKMEVIMEDS